VLDFTSSKFKEHVILKTIYFANKQIAEVLEAIKKLI